MESIDATMQCPPSTSTLQRNCSNPTPAQRQSVALDAASLGRLFRLPEVVVETVSVEARRHECAWQLKRSEQTQVLKSSFLRCVQEAAAVGLMKRLEPEEIETNVDHTNHADGGDHRTQRQYGKGAYRPLEMHVHRSREAKARRWSSSAGILEAYQQQDEIMQTWLIEYPSADDSGITSPLPSPVVPRWRKRFSGMTPYKLRECVTLEAANQAFERTWRLENESDGQLNIRDGCACVYCSNMPTPYQTQAYQRLSKDPTYFPPPPMTLSYYDEEYLAMKAIQEVLPTPVIPSLATLYGSKAVASVILEPGIVKKSLDRILPEVTNKACDRTFKLLERGQAHSVTDRCSCTYCGTASPLQTRLYQRLSRRELSSEDLYPKPPTPMTLSSPPAMAGTTILSYSEVPRSVIHPSPCSVTMVAQRDRDQEPRRWCSTPAFSSTPDLVPGTIRTVARDYNKKNPILPSWVSPLSNRKRIASKWNGRNATMMNDNVTPPPSRKTSITIHGPCAVSPSDVMTKSFILDVPLPFLDEDDVLFPISPGATKQSLDGDVDEEVILQKELYF